MAMMIGGCSFDFLGPAERVQVMQLAILADLSTDIQLIGEHVAVLAKHGEGLVEQGVAQAENLDSIQASMYDVGRWFEVSKVFDGLPR